MSWRIYVSIVLLCVLSSYPALAGELDTEKHEQQLYEYYGLDSVTVLSPDSELRDSSGNRIRLAIPKPWLQMPPSHIEGYFGGRPPGTYTETTRLECPNGFGNITYSYMRAPLGKHMALLSATPADPILGDSAGLVYITYHPNHFNFTGGLDQIADWLRQEHEKIAKREGKMEHYPSHGVVRVRDMLAFTSITEFSQRYGDGSVRPDLTNCTVHIIDREQEKVWTFILLSYPEHFSQNIVRFVDMLYSARFGP